MINLSDAVLKEIIVHHVTNKVEESHTLFSKSSLNIDNEFSLKLNQYFLGRFLSDFESFRFYHSSNLKYNEVYNYAKEIFDSDDNFIDGSVKIAQHLVDTSTHPNIKNGELYVCHFTNCILDSKSVECIGIFKSETKSGFVETTKSRDQLNIRYREGMDFNKFDKGCLIFNTNQKEGYIVKIIDNTNRSSEAQYWKDDFLGLQPINDNYLQTKEFLGITKDYIMNQFSEEFEVSKADKIDMLNRSMDYFKNNENFDKKEFEKEVFQDNQVINAFRKFDSIQREEQELDIAENFEISNQAVKKQTKAFKSVLKLDKNFHVYIHGNGALIERGYDEINQKHYYKLFFDNEI